MLPPAHLQEIFRQVTTVRCPLLYQQSAVGSGIDIAAGHGPGVPFPHALRVRLWLAVHFLQVIRIVEYADRSALSKHAALNRSDDAEPALVVLESPLLVLITRERESAPPSGLEPLRHDEVAASPRVALGQSETERRSQKFFLGMLQPHPRGESHADQSGLQHARREIYHQPAYFTARKSL